MLLPRMSFPIKGQNCTQFMQFQCLLKLRLQYNIWCSHEIGRLEELDKNYRICN